MKLERHSKIVELIGKYEIDTQEELAERLRESGFTVTQATVSRDIRELKLTKISMDNGRQRYSVMQGQDSHSDKYIRILQDGYLSMDRAMNILVLRTVPGIVLRSTAIVGFPGETDEDFAELCAFLKEAKFERFGAFPYSREEDTPAYAFEDQIDEQTKQDRYDILMQTQLSVSEEYNRSRVGQVVRVMCEGYDPVAGSHYGRSYAEAADIDGKIWFSVSRPDLRVSEGEMIDVKITEAMDYDLVGEAMLFV